MKLRILLLASICSLITSTVFASGYGVFTQGASGLGQANAVVAHTTGPSSLYFNPALLNDVRGTQLEIGFTGVYADREIDLDSGRNETGDSSWEFPSTLYLTHELNDQLTAGLGIFFPFGLSNEWDKDYEGRYIGTEGEITTTNINPAISWKVSDQVSIAAGLSAVYFDATLKSMINQTAAYLVASSMVPLPPLALPLRDIEQEFEGDDWGYGYNLGLLVKLTDSLSIGAAFRSEIELEVDGDVKYTGADPVLAAFFTNTGGDTDVTLPRQLVVGIASNISEDLVVEIGMRWEDWESTDELRIELDVPVFMQTAQVIPRDWRSTMTYNIGGQYRLSDSVALNAGYLYGKNAIPDNTFEPLIPDSDAHLFCLGTEISFGQWTVAGAFGYEYHEERDKQNSIGDPVGSMAAGMSVNTANGSYDTEIYLVGISVGYAF